MARYLIEASYTHEGLQGVLKEGGSGRRDAIGKLLADLGGSLESFHFAFGEQDAYVIVDVPDNVTAAAISMTVGASGVVGTDIDPERNLLIVRGSVPGAEGSLVEVRSA